MELFSPGAVGPPAPVGRESELPAITRLLEPSSSARRVLILGGEPGIGKTTLWEAGTELARTRGLTVLRARASEAETKLSFAGLSDLLDRLELSSLAELPAPQRTMLDVAMRRAEPSGSPPDQLAIAVGLLTVLRLLAEQAPVLVAIDDLPWLDHASQAALAFAVRRLEDCDVRFLASRRTAGNSELERALALGATYLQLGPLSFGAIGRLLSDRFELQLPRRVLRQLYETAAGNPLFAIELARALVTHGVPEFGTPLPVPEVLGELFAARVQALAPEVRRALMIVAESGGVGAQELAGAIEPAALADARAEGVVIEDRGRLHPSHPLLAAAARASASARERSELHLTLGRSLRDPVLRARHLAIGATPEDGVAAELSAAAALAAERGSADDAIVLSEQALKLTRADAEDYEERLLAFAGSLCRAGELSRMSELLTPTLASLPRGRTRGLVHLLLAEGPFDCAASERHLALALTESCNDPQVRARALAGRSMLLTVGLVSRIGEADRLAREALERSPDPETTAVAMLALAWAQILGGKPLAERIARAAERPAAIHLAFRGELEAAGKEFRRMHASKEERGESPAAGALQTQLCELALRVGDGPAAARSLAEWEQWVVGDDGSWAMRARLNAVLAAVLGEAARAIELGEPVLSESVPQTSQWDRLEALRAVGLASLLMRDSARAADSFGAVWEHTVREGIDDPGAFPVAGDLVQVLVETGQPAQAQRVAARLRRLAVAQRHPWGLASAHRAAATIELASGYSEPAAAALADAANRYRGLGCRFEHARTLMFLGVVQRRSKKRAAARTSLAEAQAGFEQLGCTGWAAQAAEELARVSGRRAPEQGDLTASERQVAELVAGGLSNKEVAARLFVSVYTVEKHLSSVYGKLGVRGRTALAGRIPAQPGR